MNATALARHLTPEPDPALQRLREVTDRIRQRAAEARARAMARGLMRGQLPLTVLPPRQGQLTLGLALAPDPRDAARAERGEAGQRAVGRQIAGADWRKPWDGPSAPPSIP